MSQQIKLAVSEVKTNSVVYLRYVRGPSKRREFLNPANQHVLIDFDAAAFSL